MFGHLLKASLAANGDKCLFGATQLDFLGHHVSASSITPFPDKVCAIPEHPEPSNTQQLQQFLGFYNFYCRFARTLRPLTDSLKGSTARKSPVQWTEEMQPGAAGK